MFWCVPGGPSKGDSSKGKGYTSASNGGAGELPYQLPVFDVMDLLMLYNLASNGRKWDGSCDKAVTSSLYPM